MGITDRYHRGSVGNRGMEQETLKMLKQTLDVVMGGTAWRGLLLMFCFLMLGPPAAAQVHDFSGTWVLNREKTQLEDMPEIVLEIVRSADAIS
jgi:hypothetical protein